MRIIQVESHTCETNDSMQYSILLSITRVNNLQGKSRRVNVFYVTGKRLEGQSSRYQYTGRRNVGPRWLFQVGC